MTDKLMMSDVDDTNSELSENEEPQFQKYKDVTIESENLQPELLPLFKSTSPILDLELGNPLEIQDTATKMSSLTITPTMPKLTKEPENQSSVILDLDIAVQLALQEIKCQNSSNIPSSSALPNTENVGGKYSSPASVTQKRTKIQYLKPISRSRMQRHGAEYKNSKLRQHVDNKLMVAPMLPLFALENNREQFKWKRNSMLLEIMQFIRKWLKRIEAMNKYYFETYQALIEKVMCVKQLEDEVKERLGLLSWGIGSSYLDQHKGTESVYESLHNRGEKILRNLRLTKKFLDSRLVKYSRTRVLYLECSIQVSTYPFEEKLFDDYETVVRQINKSSVLMDKKSVQLEEASSIVDYYGSDCADLVEQYFKELEVVF